MWEGFAVASISLTVGGFLVRYRARRRRLYRELASIRRALPQAEGRLLDLEGAPKGASGAFSDLPLARAAGVLTGAGVEQLAAEALANRSRVERSYIPTHKQGGTVSYEVIHRHAPRALAVYHSAAFSGWLSGIVGAAVGPTADHDESSCSLLVYTEPGDHIDWHYDHNF